MRNRINALTKKLKHVTDLRDSLHHPEDRAVGKNQKREAIEWKDPESVGFRAGRVTQSSMTFYSHNAVTITAGDGTHPTIHLSHEYVKEVRHDLQGVIDAFDWDPEGWDAHWAPR